MSSCPSPVSCARRSRWPRTAALKPASRRCALPLKAAHRPARARPQHTPAVLPMRPLPRSPLLRSFRRSQPPPRSSTRPLQPPNATRAPSQTGRSPKQGTPRPGSLCAAGRPTTDTPPPIRGHKSTVGKPLVLPHPFPDQGRHRSRPIPASRAALHAQGLHCFSFVISKVFFVNQGPIRDRNKNSRDLPVKPSLK
jgi:hypothetical protein